MTDAVRTKTSLTERKFEMSHAEKCPVCNGIGKYEKEQCHGCNGTGWITVHDKDKSMPYIPYVPGYPEQVIHWDIPPGVWDTSTERTCNAYVLTDAKGMTLNG